MNNFDENQNINGADNADEFSTVFSDPSAHKNTAEHKTGNGKKRLRNIIASVLAVALLITSTLLAIKLIPEKNDESTQSTKITVLEMSDNDVQKITVNNQNGGFVLNNTTSDEDAESEIYTWMLDGYEEGIISSDMVSNIASSVLNISALREITTRTAEECGLLSPKIKADVVKNDKTEFSVLIGEKSLDNTGVYLKLSTQDKIYLVTDLDEELTFTALDLADTSSIPALTLENKYSDYLAEGVLNTFEKLTVSGKKFPEKIVFIQNNDDRLTDVVPYIISEPVYRIANNAEVAFVPFGTGVSVSGAYALDVKPKTLNELGLNSPDIAVTAKFDDYSYTFKFKKQQDGDYAVWHTDAKHILKVSESALELFKYDTVNFYSPWICFISIDELSGFEVISNDKNYKFDIKVDNSEDAEETYVINYNGKKLTASNFQEFYRYCISLEASDFVIEDVKGNPSCELRFNYSEKGRESSIIKFYKISATKYQFSVDGEMIGKVNASDVNRIVDYAESVIIDKEIDIV